MSTGKGRRHSSPVMMAAALTLSLLLTGLSGSVAVAQDIDCSDWASNTLEIMAPAAPGGGWDTTAREMQNTLQNEGIVDTVEVFNVEGAGGTIGLAELVNEHAGDDHMMMMMGLVMVGGIALNESPVDLTQVSPIARITTEFEVIVVPANSEIETLDDLMAAFQDNPSGVSWAGGSAGGTDHLLVGLLAQSAGIDPSQINYVPFSGGGEALSAILGGETTAGVSGLGEWQSQIESGELRALAVSGRSGEDTAATPAAGEGTSADFGAEIPTLQESGIDVELANWRGLVAPPEITDEARDCMVQSVQQATQTQSWLTTLDSFGWVDFYLGGDEFTVYLEDEAQRVQDLLTELGLIE